MTILQNLQYQEHLSEPMAELITIYSKEFDNDVLGEKVLGEIADKTFSSSQDSKSPRSFSRFLIRLCEINPRMVLKQIVLLQKHLDSEVRASSLLFSSPLSPSFSSRLFSLFSLLF